MKYFLNLLNTKTPLLLLIIVCLPILLHSFNIHIPCINSDEASFAYNAYSILKTGKDEYGSPMPMRFKAFGENKLPVTVYTIVPSLALFGLNDVSARLPFIILGIGAPILFYFLAKELFGNKYIALIAAFLASLSPWIQILSRHIHEAIIIMYLGGISLIFLMKLMKKPRLKYIVFLAVLNGIALFTYHIAKVFSIFFLLWIIGILWYKKSAWSHIGKAVLMFMIPILLFFITEALSPTNRVNNLLFINNQGFSMTIDDLRRHNPNRSIHNKLTHGVNVLTKQYLAYFSPEFLVIEGDVNKRFGFPGISPITPIEYLFLFIGLYYLFSKQHPARYLLLSTLLFAPMSAALTWHGSSITRSFFMIVPILLIASLGIYHLSISVNKSNLRFILYGICFMLYAYFVFFTWEFYFYQYPTKTEALYAWQCGYKDVTDYVRREYDRVDKFYITKKLGQPYIFTLFYLNYPPMRYQQEARLGALDEYGFGQVERYDKFEFNFASPEPGNNVYIGYPEDFQGTNLPEEDITKIKIHTDELFWIYHAKQEPTQGN